MIQTACSVPCFAISGKAIRLMGGGENDRSTHPALPR